MFLRHFTYISGNGKSTVNKSWLVVSTHLKNISQIGWFPQVGLKVKNVWNHHLERKHILRDNPPFSGCNSSGHQKLLHFFSAKERSQAKPITLIYFLSSPWKLNIAPENILSQKDNSLPTISFSGSMLNFGDVWLFLAQDAIIES